MKSIIFRSFFILFVFFSCLSPFEQHVKKREKAKERISSLLRSFPELMSSDTMYITKIDTHVNERTIVFNDSILVPVEYIDSSMHIEYDSIYRVNKGNLELIVRLTKSQQLLFEVIKNAQTIYYTDTVTLRDTIFNTLTKIEYRTTLDTQPSFWWSLWFNVRNWLWLVILVAAFIIIYKLTRK